MNLSLNTNRTRIDRLNGEKNLSPEDWTELLSSWTESDREYAAELACAIARARFGNRVYIRGIVEFSNICRNDCLYCGIRKSNANLERYRLSEERILECCRAGYRYGFRTFVLQSGEDAYFTRDRMVSIVSAVRREHPDCALTLSLGELPAETYKALREAGADRYLLRHETANAEHYAKLHPAAQKLETRMRCLRDLRECGFQTGSGFMVGSPYQTPELLAEDMAFLAAFKPEMIGIGPFIPHRDTPFRDMPPGSVPLTLFLLSLCRIMLPGVLLPATTALGTLDPGGRLKGILSGANVVMPNISPDEVRKNYMLYNNKLSADVRTDVTESELQKQLETIGYTVSVARGDYGDESC